MQRRSVLKGLVAAGAATSFPLVRGDAADAASEPKHHKVVIKSFAYVPANLDVNPGDKITWSNEDIVPHTATAVDESWDTGSIANGESRTLTAKEGMSADYFCRFHPSMLAKISL